MLSQAFATHKADPPPPAPGTCAKCPADKPHPYGSASAGIYCCPTASEGHCGAHGAKAPECCLQPGSGEGCQVCCRPRHAAPPLAAWQPRRLISL